MNVSLGQIVKSKARSKEILIAHSMVRSRIKEVEHLFLKLLNVIESEEIRQKNSSVLCPIRFRFFLRVMVNIEST